MKIDIDKIVKALAYINTLQPPRPAKEGEMIGITVTELIETIRNRREEIERMMSVGLI